MNIPNAAFGPSIIRVSVSVDGGLGPPEGKVREAVPGEKKV